MASQNRLKCHDLANTICVKRRMEGEGFYNAMTITWKPKVLTLVYLYVFKRNDWNVFRKPDKLISLVADETDTAAEGAKEVEV